MIITIDIGNSNIVLSSFDDETIIFTSRVATQCQITEDQYIIEILNILNLYNIDIKKIEGAIISSVVPQLTNKIKIAVSRLIKGKIFIVGPGIKTGLNIKIDLPSELGADFVCSSVYAKAKYPLPLIVIDMGTATKISALDKNGDFIGGSIMPGVGISIDALSAKTAQLPYINIEKPNGVIGKNTVDCMKSGIIYGTAIMIDGMIKLYEKELNSENLTVIVTGGNAGSIISFCEHKIIHDDDVILKGLKIIYDKQC